MTEEALMKKWIKNHLILLWVICSIVFAFIIHCLFSKAAPNEWWEAEWGAGDILTYVSTVALGLLAVWQNQKFKEESDQSQERMEKLTNKTNEIALISKVIEHESARISRLKVKKQNFIDACNTEQATLDVSDISNYPADYRKIYIKIKMDNRCSQIRLCTVELLNELALYNSYKQIIKLIDITSEYSKASLEFAKEVRMMSASENTYNHKKELESQFIIEISSFITDREQLLNQVIYGDFSFEQIKAMYGETSTH